MTSNKCIICRRSLVIQVDHEDLLFLDCLGNTFEAINKLNNLHRDTNVSTFCSSCRVVLVRLTKLNTKLKTLACKVKQPWDARTTKVRAVHNVGQSNLTTDENSSESDYEENQSGGQSEDGSILDICAPPPPEEDLHLELQNDTDPKAKNRDDVNVAHPLLDLSPAGATALDVVQSVEENQAVSSKEDAGRPIATFQDKWVTKKLELELRSSQLVKRISDRDFIYMDKYTFQGTDFGFKCGSCPLISKFSTSKTSPLWFNIIVHIGKWHMREDKVRTYKTVQRCIQVAPNRFQYGKYCFEKVDGKYQCGVCGTLKHARAYKHKTKYIVEHIMQEHDNPSRTYVCEYCGVVYKNRDSLRTHKIAKHEQPNAQFPCSDCGKTFKTRSGAFLHQNRIHLNIDKHYDFICEICGKKYWSKAILRDHVAFVHNGQKMKCEDCGKMFASNYSLNTHRRSHTGKKYTCDICGMDFTQHYSVARHKKTAHGA